MVEVNDSVVSPDGALKVTLIAFDPMKGTGRVKIEEPHGERGRFYVTVKYVKPGRRGSTTKRTMCTRRPSSPLPPTGMMPSRKSTSSGFPLTDLATRSCPESFFFSC
jgi:hypothetical protein